MSNARQFVGGLLIALVAMFLIGSSLVTAIAEDRLLVDPPPLRPTEIITIPVSTQTPIILTPVPEASETYVPTETPLPTQTACKVPESWFPYTMTGEDSIDTLATAINIDKETLLAGNCLSDTSANAGTIIYLPTRPATATSQPTKTPENTATTEPVYNPPINTPISCGPPSSWVLYTVQSGDTLYSLANSLDVTVRDLQIANCLGASTYIRAGDQIWVPFVATRTPTPTQTFTPTVEPSLTPTATSTDTPLPPPTDTSTPEPTATFTPTDTPVPPSETPTGSP